jgi:hypothetical protein
MGCIPSKTSDPTALQEKGNLTRKSDRNGVESGHSVENGTDNKSDSDSVAEFRARVREAKPMDDIFQESQSGSQGTRDSLTGGLSIYNNTAKKRESISEAIIRKFCSILMIMQNTSGAIQQ